MNALAEILRHYKNEGYKEIETNAYNDPLTEDVIKDFENDEREYSVIIESNGIANVFMVDGRGYLIEPPALSILPWKTDETDK